MTTTLLVVPGIGNSGPAHWQSLWEGKYPNCHRVQQDHWDEPACDEWLVRLDEAVARAGPATVLVAHSLGCLLVAHWAQRSRHRVQGALLVAVPDPRGVAFPANAIGFAPVPLQCPLPMRSLVVASTDDPYATVDFARTCANAWGSGFECIGAAGHINAASGLGEWPQGQRLLEPLLREP